MFRSNSSVRPSNTNNDSAADNLPDSVNEFFRSVHMDCFPEADGLHAKAQPWKSVWTPQPPSADGKLLIAYPKNCQWGELYLPSLYPWHGS
jgi:hypothetical protein